jgi:hypothetical protein
VDLPFDVGTPLASGIDENRVGLKPTRGVERELVVFSRMRYFPGPFPRPLDEAGDAGFVID